MRRLAVIALVLVAAAPAARPRRPRRTRAFLVFTKTGGYRHESIPAAHRRRMRNLGARNGFDVTATEDERHVHARQPRAVRRGDVPAHDGGRARRRGPAGAFESYIRAGHGFVGVHSASDTERDWPWYGRLVGAYSSGHPEIQEATVRADGAARELDGARCPRAGTAPTSGTASSPNPRAAGVRVLLTLDETTYMPREFGMGADHPIAWQHEFNGGRAWYTAGGHTTESYSEPLFLGHLLARDPVGARAPSPSAVEKPMPACRSEVQAGYTGDRPPPSCDRERQADPGARAAAPASSSARRR